MVALGVVQSVGSCGGPNIPYRFGRVDATGPGNFGTPEPDEGLEETLARAKYSGYSQTEFMCAPVILTVGESGLTIRWSYLVN